MITIELTTKQAKQLTDILLDATDQGPEGYGWKSKELATLTDVIWSQVYPDYSGTSQDVGGLIDCQEQERRYKKT